MKAQALVTIARDVLSMALGVFIAVNEEVTGSVHPELLTLAAGLLGAPSIAALLSLSRGKRATPDTPESSDTSPSVLPPLH